MRRLAGLMLVLSLGLTACVSSTPYGPITERDPYGFSDQKIEEDRYRISFHGNASTSRESVETFLLYRAAEVTINNGFDYFIMAEHDTEVKKSYPTSTHYPAYYGRYPHRRDHGGTYDAFPYYAYGFEWGHPYDMNIQEITRYSAIAFVSLQHGVKPAENTRAFEAREVLMNLAPYIAASRN